MSRIELIPPEQIEPERARWRRRFADRYLAQKLGVFSTLCASLICGAGLVVHAVVR